MPLNIEIQNLQTEIPLKLATIKTAIRKVLRKLGLTQGYLSFVFVNDRRIRVINQKYLRHDYATDVLTFDWSATKKSFAVEGEIIISAQTARRNAKEYGATVADEIVLYMVHGLLHLLGYDDHSASGIKRMRAKERELMRHCFGLRPRNDTAI